MVAKIEMLITVKCPHKAESTATPILSGLKLRVRRWLQAILVSYSQPQAPSGVTTVQLNQQRLLLAAEPILACQAIPLHDARSFASSSTSAPFLSHRSCWNFIGVLWPKELSVSLVSSDFGCYKRFMIVALISDSREVNS